MLQIIFLPKFLNFKFLRIKKLTKHFIKYIYIYILCYIFIILYILKIKHEYKNINSFLKFNY